MQTAAEVVANVDDQKCHLVLIEPLPRKKPATGLQQGTISALFTFASNFYKEIFTLGKVSFTFSSRYYTALPSCDAVYCNRSCVWVCVCVCGSVTMIARNCVHRSSLNWLCR